MRSYFVVLLFCFLGLSLAYRQKISLFSGQDNTGDGVILKEHYDDLSKACFFKKTNYFCLSGMWALYTEKNFTLHADNKVYTLPNNCVSSPLPNAFGSIRYLGAPDTDAVALSTYEGEFVSGKGRTYTTVANSGASYPLKSLALTGWSNWTLYTGPDFTGVAYCLRSTAQTHYMPQLGANYPPTVSSILRGCDGKTKTILL